MAEIATTKRAKADLKRIWRFIALDNRDAATKLLMQIDQRISQLSAFPESGAMRNDVRKGCRMLVVAGYRVLYEYLDEADQVEIIAVVEPYRDMEGIV